MANEQIVQGLISLRAAVGAGVWIAPRFSGRMFGLDPAANPQAPYVARLFAIRDLILAYGLSTSSGAQRTVWLRAGVACDLADTLAGLIAGRNRELPKAATMLVTATALGGAAMGLVALQDEPPPAV